jgi:hypothetical protein
VVLQAGRMSEKTGATTSPGPASATPGSSPSPYSLSPHPVLKTIGEPYLANKSLRGIIGPFIILFEGYIIEFEPE